VPFLLFDLLLAALRCAYGTEAVKDYLAPSPASRPGPAVVGRLHAELFRITTAAWPRAAAGGLLDRVVDVMIQAHDALSTQYFAT